jgi:hypothetical protein
MGWHYTTSQKVVGSGHNEVTEFLSVYIILPDALDSGGYSASNIKELQKKKSFSAV